MTIPYKELDVRPILREGGEPFGAIMAAETTASPNSERNSMEHLQGSERMGGAPGQAAPPEGGLSRR